MNPQEKSVSDLYAKRYVRYKEGAVRYSMSQSKFERLAKEAGAVLKIDKLVLVDCEAFERYLESFRQ